MRFKLSNRQGSCRPDRSECLPACRHNLMPVARIRSMFRRDASFCGWVASLTPYLHERRPPA
jgi:hypothetical protein